MSVPNSSLSPSAPVRTGWRKRGVWVPVTVIVASLLGFAVLSVFVVNGSTEAFDDEVVRAARSIEDPAEILGPDWLGEVARDFTTLGGYSLIILLLINVCLYLTVTGHRDVAIAFAVTVIGAYGTSMGIKLLFDRPRPMLVPHLSYVNSHSFPSAHAMMSTVLYLSIGYLLAHAHPSRLLKGYLFLLALSIAIAVGSSRVYLGVHYPSDVLAGWMLGWAWVSASYLLFHRLRMFDSLPSRR